MNARYYEGSRGQFISQDPVFWEIGRTKDGITVLTNPQAQNSYSYAINNPIINKDPDGRCPICVPLLIGGGVGLVGGIGNQVLNDYLTGDFGNRSFTENVNTYSVAAGQGAIVGAGVVAAGAIAATAGLTAIPTALTVGGTAGTLTLGTTVVGDKLLGQQTNTKNLIVNTSISTVTAGALDFLPKVPGRLPNIGTKAFFSGAHTTRQGAEEAFSGSMQALGQSSVNAVQSLIGKLQDNIKSFSSSQGKKNNK